MKAMDLKEELIATLRSTLIGNSESLQKTTEYLAEASKQTGFCMAMMEIVDDQTLHVEVKQASLIQLKNTIKLRWNAKTEELDKNEKEYILGAILQAVKRYHKNKNHLQIKLYKKILTIIARHQYRQWPVRQIVKYLAQQYEPIAMLHVLLAIAASFEFSITEDERTYFLEFLKTALPSIQDLLSPYSKPQLIYLSIKFLWKAVHSEISPEIKQMTCNWMALLQAAIGDHNPLYDLQPEDVQVRGTKQFYYFHSKKWATRILLQFFQKHASYNNEDNRVFSDYWFQTYGTRLVAELMWQSILKTPKKVRYFQLKCVQTLIKERPDAVKPLALGFQYDTLLHYLRLQPQDEELANRDPVKFLSREDEPSINSTNLKRVATDVWVGFAELGSKIKTKTQNYEPGDFFFQNINYLKRKIRTDTPVEKELAMYLICQLRSPILMCRKAEKILLSLISQQIIPDFAYQSMFLRARALDIFIYYESIQLGIDVVRTAVKEIYLCLTKDANPLVRIKAAIALNCILKHKAAKDFVRPHLNDILTVYLQLLESYDLQNLVNSLLSIVQEFCNEIGPFCAVDLVHHFFKQFFKRFNKDAEQVNQQGQDGLAKLGAAGCLKTIALLIKSPIHSQAVARMEQDVVVILEFVFAGKGIDYIQDALVLLKAYLFKVPRITAQIWVFYYVVVFYNAGISFLMRASLEQHMPQKQKQIIMSIRPFKNYQMIKKSMFVLRNFIHKSSVSNEPNQKVLNADIVQLAIYLLSEMHERPPNDFNGELDISWCTILLIYLMESYPRSQLRPYRNEIYQLCKLNVQNCSSMRMRVLTSQLIGLLLQFSPFNTLYLAQRGKILTIFLKELISYQNKYKKEYERARVIFGLNALLDYPQKPEEIIKQMPKIFKTAVFLVKKNAEERIDEKQQQKAQTSNISIDQDDLQIYHYEDGEEDFWQEQYGGCYNSRLDSYDEIAEFKSTIERLCRQEPQFFRQIMKSVPPEQFQALQENIQKALKKKKMEKQAENKR